MKIFLCFWFKFQKFGFLIFGEKVISSINWFVSDSYFRHITQRFIPAFNENIFRIYQIRIYILRIYDGAVGIENAAVGS